MILLYSLLLVVLSIYSYALIDPNITFFNHRLWSRFLEQMLQVGYYQRLNSWMMYVGIVGLLFIFNRYFVKKYDKFDPFKIAILIGLLLIASYPFLSHDFLKYMFDAKILTVYHQNPYVFRPMDFPHDLWLRFLQWTHQSYRYGPVFLGLSIIPSFLSLGKFLPDFLLFKSLTIFFYVLAVHFLGKINKKNAIELATHPFIIIEGLVNGHNDIIALAIVIAGIYCSLNKKNLTGRILFLLSCGIKYLTLPIVFLSSNKKSLINKFLFVLFLLLPIALLNQFIGNLFMAEIQTWYFIILFAFLAFYDNIISNWNIFLFGLLLSYYPFIRFGEWQKLGSFDVKHIIIISSLILNAIILVSGRLITRMYEKKE